MNRFSKVDLYGSLPLLLSRLSPYIITEINKPINKSLLRKELLKLEPYVMLEKIESPSSLFSFIQDHQEDLIIIWDDIFSKSKNLIDIVQGAVCSSPESATAWTVNYLDKKSFIFKGKIILCTNSTADEIKSDKRLSYIARDCKFI